MSFKSYSEMNAEQRMAYQAGLQHHANDDVTRQALEYLGGAELSDRERVVLMVLRRSSMGDLVGTARDVITELHLAGHFGEVEG